MNFEWPSSTNKGTALLKLAHQFDPNRIVHDDYAAWFFEKHEIEAVRQMSHGHDADGLGTDKTFTRIAYYYTILREKVIDDWINSSIGFGCRQLLLVGAGYDTRFFRLPMIRDHSVATFEVDLPQTIARKTAILRNHLYALPDRLTFIPIDFNHGDLSIILEYGFKPLKPTAYVWQGTSYYLPEESVSAVLDFIHKSMSSGSTLVFDSCSPLMTYPNDKIPGLNFNVERLKKIGEPYRFGMEATTMRRWLEQKGFKNISIQQQSELETMIMKTHALPENMWYVVTAKE